MTTETTTYKGSGVNYADMDPFKREAQLAARETARNIERLGLTGVEESRGESAYLIELPNGGYVAHVEEGLGTKNLVADAMYALTHRSFYEALAQDTVAMIVNDLITLGALPASVAMHLAVGSSEWFKDTRRSLDLIIGWRRACNMAGCVWSGGETPTLRDIIMPDSVVLSGSGIGFIRDERRRINGDIRAGDAIILIESSGIHANGLTLARKIASMLPDGYMTTMADGRLYGAALLDPTHIYAHIIERLQNWNIDIRYAANITGHGWRKLMRHPKPFAYVIDRIPKPQPVFDFIQKHGPVSDREAYGNLNMGAGFALYVPEDQAERTVEAIVTDATGDFRAFIAGHVEKSDTKKVVILPKGIEFSAAELAVR